MQVMQMSLVDKIPDFKVFGVPLGAAAKGLVVWGIGDVIALAAARYLPAKIPAGGVKLGIAALLQESHVKGFIGPTSANIGSLLLAVDGISTFFDLRGKVRNTLGGIVNKWMPAAAPTAVTTTTPASSISSGIPTF